MEFLMAEAAGKPLWMWAIFIAIVLVLLVIDLGLFNRKDHVIGVRESLLMSGFYIAIALVFGGFVWWQLGPETGSAYYTGYLVEKTLSMDNIFVISLIFTALSIPALYQHRVLFWGILGVIVLRGLMIGLGAALIHSFSWVMYLFALFLIGTGVKMLFVSDDEPDMADNKILRFLRRHLPVTPDLRGKHFLVRENGKWFVTPLLVALLLVEFIDLIFAVDSVPAIFALTDDPYVIYTSNIMAILGLRALYFALAAIIHRFVYLKPALAAVLIFIGSKVFITDLLDLQKFPASLSLGITIGLLAIGLIASLIKTRNDEKKAEIQA